MDQSGATAADPNYYPQDDAEFVVITVDAVTSRKLGHFEIEGGGRIFAFSIPDELAPRPGDVVRIYFSLTNTKEGRIRGVWVRERKGYYLTPAQDEAKRDEELVKWEAGRKADFESGRADLDARVVALPDELRRRVERFRDGQPDFRWKYEAFEVFCCEEAAKLVAKFRLLPRKSWKAWCAAEPAKQFQAMPGLSKNNDPTSLGVAGALAEAIMQNPLALATTHGAGAHLVGCVEYGCHPGGKS